MDVERDILVEIDNLYVNFYTYQGVVKAIDGVDLQIKKGETLGLVGETGCGKSVTASTIMKLILMPPGKIEGGSIFFMEPPEVREKRKEFERKVQEWYSGLPNNEKRKIAAQHGTRFTGYKKRVKPLSKNEQESIEIPARIPERAARIQMASMAKKVRKEDRTTLDALRRTHDLIPKQNEYMQMIRGKWISMIFQEPTSALNPVFTAGDQIAEVILLHRRAEMASRALDRVNKELAKKNKSIRSYLRIPILGTARTILEAIKKNPRAKIPLIGRIPFLNRFRTLLEEEALKDAVLMLKTVRIPDPEGVASRYPFELSGGMQQRVMIAMALACNPRLLIADEPTTALDVTIQGQILKLMRDLKQEYGSSILLITHNLGVVAEMCDRVGVMYAGSMAEVGGARAIFKSPLHPYTVGLMKAVPSIQMGAEKLFTIRGSVPNLIYPPSGCRFHPRCDYAKEYCKTAKPLLTEIEPGHKVSCHMVAKAEGYVNG